MFTRHPAFWRYTAFQIPGWVLAAIGGWWIHTSLSVPLWVAAGVLVVWVIKDYALYPVLRFAYEADHRLPIEYLIGSEATTVEPLDPTGYVRVRGELWKAQRDRSGDHVTPGTAVQIIGVEGTMLLVSRKKTSEGGRN